MKVVLVQSLEHPSDMDAVLFLRLAEDQDVVQVDDNVSCYDFISQDVVHESLEVGRGVCQAKEHDHGFEQSSVRSQSCLPLITFLDPDVIIAPSDIKFGKEA